MSKRKKTFVTIAILMAVVALGLAAGVYAKYIASLTKTGGAKVATWEFESENANGSFTCELTGDDYVSGAIKTEDGSVIIAPGTHGECKVKLSNTQSEVAVDYKITADTANFTNVPKNLKLVGDSGSAVAPASFVKTGSLAIGASNQEVTIGWDWPYETGDAVTDGAIVDGQKAGDLDDNGDAGKTMTLSFKIQGVQKKPTSN